jgi:hypothetical protein
MPVITVTFFDPVTNEERPDSAVSESMTAVEVARCLAQSGFMPAPESNGRCVLEVRGKNSITGEQTLASGGFSDGDRIIAMTWHPNREPWPE